VRILIGDSRENMVRSEKYHDSLAMYKILHRNSIIWTACFKQAYGCAEGMCVSLGFLLRVEYSRTHKAYYLLRRRARENVDGDSYREVSHKRLNKKTIHKKIPATAHPHLAFEY
jgi:hypothetical protein